MLALAIIGLLAIWVFYAQMDALNLRAEVAALKERAEDRDYWKAQAEDATARMIAADAERNALRERISGMAEKTRVPKGLPA